MTTFALAAAMLLLSAELSGFEPALPLHEPNAVLLNISEADLNRIVRDAFREQVGPRVERASSDPSRGIHDLRYAASFSEPVLKLDSGGGVRVNLNLLEADLRIGRFERRFMRRMASCDGAGVSVDPDRPIEVALHMRFQVNDHDLQILPSSVTVDDPKGFRLVKPTSCRNTWLPKWVVWRIGKRQLRHRLKELDEMLLAKAQLGAAELSEETSLLTNRLSIQTRDRSGAAPDLQLYPQRVDTSNGSLLLSFSSSTTQLQMTKPSMPDWVASESHRSYLGLSESFVNSAARAAIGRLRTRPREPSDNLSKLFRTGAGRALIPGLRDMPSPENLRLGLAFHSPPIIQFDALGHESPERTTHVAPNRALIRIRLSGAQLTIWESEELLGALEIESARLAVAPYLNLLGGISFDIVENEWRLSSRNIDFDVETLAAMFQELFFGEMFETRYQPVAQSGFDLGETRFRPRYFSLLGDYLVIGLSEF